APPPGGRRSARGASRCRPPSVPRCPAASGAATLVAPSRESNSRGLSGPSAPPDTGVGRSPDPPNPHATTASRTPLRAVTSRHITSAFGGKYVDRFQAQPLRRLGFIDFFP